MPQLGQILLYVDYVFEDGTKGNKLFIILTEADLDTPSLVLKTTSQSKRYQGAKEGCNPQMKVFFIPTDWGDCFPLDTYVQLPEIIEISTKDLLQGSLSKTIRMVSSLSANHYSQLRNCLKYFRKDISEQHWKLIFSK